MWSSIFHVVMELCLMIFAVAAVVFALETAFRERVKTTWVGSNPHAVAWKESLESLAASYGDHALNDAVRFALNNYNPICHKFMRRENSVTDLTSSKKTRSNHSSVYQQLRRSKSTSVHTSVPMYDVTPSPLMDDIRYEQLTKDFFIDYVSNKDKEPEGVLVKTTMCVLHRWKLFGFLNNSQSMLTLLEKIEAGYKSNPYHSALHAADVTARLAAILEASGLASHLVKTNGGCTQLVAIVLSAAMHDLEHPGHNNQFAVNMELEPARLFNNQSVYENWALVRGLELIEQAEFYRELPKHRRLSFKDAIITAVLATDMAKHFEAVSAAYQLLERQRGAMVESQLSSILDDDPFKLWNDEDIKVVLCLALKAADLGHTTTPVVQHVKWVSRLQEEMFLQGDAERSLQSHSDLNRTDRCSPLSPLADREKSGPCNGDNQVVFFEMIVIPMYKILSEFLPETAPLLKQAEVNLEYWRTHPGNCDPDNPFSPAEKAEKDNPFQRQASLPSLVRRKLSKFSIDMSQTIRKQGSSTKSVDLLRAAAPWSWMESRMNDSAKEDESSPWDPELSSQRVSPSDETIHECPDH